MKVLTLFLTFLKIGAVSFGGGYGMLPLIRDETLSHGWLTEDALLNLIAVSESTPGPIAINAATFIGSTQAGIPGALAATLGVVLPSFVLILLIAAAVRNLMKYRAVQGILSGIRPCVIGLILAAALSMLLSNLFGIRVIGDRFSLSLRGCVILVSIVLTDLLTRRFAKKPLSPILLILFSAVLGAVLYAI